MTTASPAPLPADAPATSAIPGAPVATAAPGATAATPPAASAASGPNAIDRNTHRLLAFSDGVFTVALTLLVIDIAVPTLANGAPESELIRQLIAQIPNIEAFLLTFWVTGGYWLVHHRHFEHIKHYDNRLLLLNLVFLMTICFIPWPTAVLGHYGNYFSVWVLYSLCIAAVGVAATVMWLYASSKPALVVNVTPTVRRYYAERAAIQPLVFLISIPIAAISLTAGQFSWIAIFVVLRWVDRRYRDTIASLRGAT